MTPGVFLHMVFPSQHYDMQSGSFFLIVCLRNIIILVGSHSCHLITMVTLFPNHEMAQRCHCPHSLKSSCQGDLWTLRGSHTSWIPLAKVTCGLSVALTLVEYHLPSWLVDSPWLSCTLVEFHLPSWLPKVSDWLAISPMLDNISTQQ